MSTDILDQPETTRQTRSSVTSSRRFGAGLRRRGLIGIDLGWSRTKIVQAESIGGVYRVCHVDSLETQADVSSDKFALSGDFAKQLVARLRGGGFLGNEAACLLPSGIYETHSIDATASDLNDSPAAVCERLRRELPASCDATSFDSLHIPGSALGDPESPGRFDINSVAGDVVERVVHALFRAGVDVHQLDAPATTASRVADLDVDVAPGDCVAVVEWGTDTTTLTVVNAGQPVFARRLRESGYGRAVVAVGEGLAITPQEANALLERYGVDQTPIGREIASHLTTIHRDLQNELNRTLTYFRRRHYKLNPTQLLLIGDGAAIPKAASIWANTFDMVAREWQPGDLFSDCPTRQSPAVFAAATALSMLGLG